MQAASTAFAALIAGNDVVVEHQVTVRLPVYRTNLCTNPNFEYGLTGWTGLGGATFAASRAQKVSGDSALLITWPTAAAGSGQVTNNVTVKPGSIYTVSAYVYVVSGPNVTLTAEGTPGTTTTATGVWQRLSVTITATDTVLTLAAITAGASTAGQQCYLDAVLVEEAATVGSYFDGDSLADLNLCPNPSFEQLILPEWWAPTAATLTQDPSWKTDGDYSCAITPTTPGSPAWMAPGGDYAAGVMRCGLVAGQTYTVSADINVPVALSGGASSTACRIVIGWDVGAGQVIGAQSAQGPIAGGTARLHVTATIPANATAAFIQLVNGYTPVPAANIVQWDSVLVRRAATDTAFFGGQRASANSWLGVPGQSASQLNVDPYPDATVAVESATVERQMVTDMPDGTRLISGYPSATATVVLSGNMDPTNESISAASVFGPYNPASPTYHSDACDSPVVIQHGIYTGAGAELVTSFTGSVDDVAVDAIADTVTLTCIDGRNKLRPTVTLPPIAYLSTGLDYAPGLTGGWIMDTLLRQNGIHSSPPPRPLCQLYVSMHGSAWPDFMGTRVSQNAPAALTCGDVLTDSNLIYAGTPADFASYNVRGPWSDECVRNPTLLSMPLALSGSINASGHLYVEGWIYCDPTQTNSASTIARFTVMSDSSTSFAGLYLTWTWKPGDATASCGLGMDRVGGSTGPDKAITGSTITTGAWHHVALLVQFTGSTTATVSSWIDRADSPTITSVTGLPAAGAEPAMLRGQFQIGGYADSIQFTNETTPTPYRAFYPQAYLDQSLNPLVAVADTAGQDPWSVFQALSEAEQGVAGLDERNVFRFRNRTNLLAATAVRKVTSTSSLKALSTDVGKSTLANHVTAAVNALSLSVITDVWSATDAIKVPAKGSYSTVVATQNIVLTPQAPDYGYGVLGNTPGVTRWRACQTPQGTTLVTTGIVVTTRSISATALALTITNSNPYPVYMVSDTGHTDVTAGTPFLHIGGQYVATPANGVVADSQWAPSIASRGEVALPLPDNQWRQDPNTTQQLTDDVLDDLYRPRPVLTGLTIVADPRLQLTDRITIVDPDGSAMLDDVVLSGLVLSDSASDWTQSLTARGVSNPGDWLMGVAGRSELGSTTYT